MTLFRNVICSSLLSALLIPSIFAGDDVSTKPKKEIQSIMSDTEFSDAGLSKLTPGELQNLNEWLYGYVEIEREAALDDIIPEGEKGFGLEMVQKEVVKFFRSTPDIIESNVIPEGKRFKGWSGKRLFYLENGQVWKQIDNSKFYYPTDDPIVQIRKGAFGAYYLNLKGKGSKCKVKRIK